MRDIRFRAWDKDRSKMWNTITIESIDFARNRLTVLYDLNITPDGQNSGIYSDTLGRFELMQYTGLKDKNGNEIYEGDIVVHDGDECEVNYKGGSFGIDFQETARKPYDRILYSSNWVVVGNKYEGIKETAVGDRT